MKKIYLVELSPKEQSALAQLTQQDKSAVREVKRAQVLLQAHTGSSDEAIAAQVGVSVPTVGRIRRQYATEGLAAALNDKPRSGRPPAISQEIRAIVTALASSPPPAGRSRWTLRLLAEKVAEQVGGEAISHQSVRTILKETQPLTR